MKTYTTKSGEDFGSIARKFGMPSWKYLYHLNKDKIGDNPDLLKEGTVLEIPQWDSTGGDEKIEAKGVKAGDYTGGARYRYPWVPFSFTMKDSAGEILQEKDEAGKESKTFSKKKEFKIKLKKDKSVVVSGALQKADEIEMLVPDIKEGVAILEIDGLRYL